MAKPHRRLRSRVAVLVAVALACAVLADGSAAGATPLDDAKARVEEAQRAADAATVRFEEAIDRLERLEARITSLQTQIREDKAEAKRLRELARERARAAYTRRDGGEVEGFLTDSDPLDRLRRDKLLEDTKRREDTAAERLAAITEDLERERTKLETAREKAEDALDAVKAEQAKVQAELAEAQEAMNALEAYLRQQEEAQRARDIAASIARSASNRAVGPVSVGSNGMVCPIRGAVSFVDSWGAPRHQGAHQGVDLMSARGTPNVATVSGNVTFKTGSTSGNGAYLNGDNGHLYYYFHLDRWEGGARHVAQGEVIGYTGNTGDARYTATHTHFEIHPNHGAAVNPYPYVRAVC